MKNSIGSLCIILSFFNCADLQKQETEKNTDEPKIETKIASVKIEDIVVDSTLNVRAIELEEGREMAVFATSDGRLGIVFPESNSIIESNISQLQFLFIDKYNLGNESPNYRSLAMTKDAMFALSIGNPAKLFMATKNDSLKLVYTEMHPNVFYDSITFWNDKEGIAMGDPTENCISIITTRDAGNTWQKLACESLPEAMDGEAAFAASDTNIAVIGDHTWIATGGKASRILYSSDRGKSWEVYDTPIIQGKETTGIYSVDFYDALNGFAIGGDYTNPDANSANKMSSTDGGKTWHLRSDGKGPGYRSCVQYVPNGDAKELLAIGFKGIDYTYDAGQTWKHLSDEGFYTLRFVNDSVAFAAGKGRISRLAFKRE